MDVKQEVQDIVNRWQETDKNLTILQTLALRWGAPDVTPIFNIDKKTERVNILFSTNSDFDARYMFYVYLDHISPMTQRELRLHYNYQSKYNFLNDKEIYLKDIDVDFVKKMNIDQLRFTIKIPMRDEICINEEFCVLHKIQLLTYNIYTVPTHVFKKIWKENKNWDWDDHSGWLIRNSLPHFPIWWDQDRFDYENESDSLMYYVPHFFTQWYNPEKLNWDLVYPEITKIFPEEKQKIDTDYIIFKLQKGVSS